MKKIPFVRFSRSEKNLDPSITRSENILKSLVLCTLLLPLSFPAQAQQPAKVWKIGVLASTSRSLNASREDSLWQGFVQAGLINSLSHPGGNVTGVSRLSPDFIGKRVELIKEVIPKARHIAALSNPDNPAYTANLREIDMRARASGIRLQIVTAHSPGEFENAFGAATKEHSDALLVMPDALFHSYPSRITELAAKSHLPAMYDRSDFVDAGGLMSFAVNIADLSRSAAKYIDQILKGSRPAELSVEEPTRYDLVVNLNAAHALGLTIPSSVLVRADKVIK